MDFAHDTQVALASAVALANEGQPDGLELSTVAQLQDWLDAEGYTGRRSRTRAELDEVLAFKTTLRAIWAAQSEEERVELVNAVLRDGPMVPQLVRHEGWEDWHLHPTSSDTPLPRRLAVEVALALVDLFRADGFDRLGWCGDPDCQMVFVDFTRNRSKKYCDTGLCANRAHQAAYRERHRDKTSN